jgi:hypothetical protein
MIDKLTHEQTARFPEFVEKWTRIGLSTEPADRPRAEAVIRLMYEAGGLTPPEKIIWFDNPMAVCVEFRKTGVEPVRDVVRDVVQGAVWDAVQDVVHGSVYSSVWNAVQGSVWDSVCDSVWDGVRSTVQDAVQDAVQIAAYNAVWNTVYGSHEACWLCRYDFYREVLGLVKETDKLTGLFELAKSCGWIIPCEKVCYASERHNILNLDNKGKLHCETGPVVVYPDGWSVFVDHGVVVPEKVVMDPGGFTFQELKKLKVRKVKIVLKKLGMEKFLSIPGTTSDTWTDLFSQIAKEAISD